MEYKVWVHIEEVEESVNEYKDVKEPVCAGVFETLEEAKTFIDRIVAAIPPKLPNQLLHTCKKAEEEFSRLGESQGFGLMGPTCWLVLEELRQAITDFEQP